MLGLKRNREKSPVHSRWSIVNITLISSYIIHYTSYIGVQAQSSVLSDGQIFKIGITKTSVYKLDATFFKNIGLNINTLNPRNISIYGNGGAMLPQASNIPRANDLTENAIFVKGEADGKFDDGDAVWFFGQSPHQIKYNTSGLLEHELNRYSDTTFYFLKIGNKAGLRIQNQASGKGGTLTNVFDDYVFRESELTNKIKSGRDWWGEYFGIQNQQTIDFDATGIVPNTTYKLTAATVAAAQVSTKFSFAINGQNIGSQSMGTVSTYRYDYQGSRSVQQYSGIISPMGNKLSIGINFDKNGQANAEGYLDFVGIQVQKTLQLYEQPTVIQSLASMKQDSILYSIGQANSNLQVWEITNSLIPKNQNYVLNGSSATFNSIGKVLKKFVLFAESQLQNPVSVIPIQNQNLHSFPTPQFLIVSSTTWQKQAQKLADFRQKNDGLTSLVVTTAQIFNEFSSGRLDPTAIRDFVKYLNEKQPNRLKYLLLFGDATYDYKNNSLGQTAIQTANFVPTYESRESASPIYSFSSDDYFGFLKPTDGEWTEDYNSNYTLDIGIGRLPVKTIEEAEVVVNKLLHYSTKKTHGNWRQKVCFVADNGDANTHQQDADNLSKIIQKNTPLYEVKKLFVDAFVQNSNPSGQRTPDLNKAIDKNIDAGVLIMNYTGHGGVSGWAEEQIVTISNILNWRNFDNMPLLVTATCEFGRTDDPSVVSGAELAALSPRGGAIGLLTTTRPVFANTNYLLNQAFYNAVFQPIDNAMPRLGDVFKNTKNNSIVGVLNRNFMLMADPSLRLNYANYQAVITSKNDTLKAGKLVKITGEIRNNNQLVSDFTGVANVSIFDKENQLLTNGNGGPKMLYGQYLSKLFEGKASVKAGKFEVQFVVPKNIDYNLGKGRIQIYAIRNDSLADAAGGSEQVWVGGSNLLINDSKPPAMQLFMNDESFIDGGEVSENPVFMARVSDENGLNIASNGIGNDMTITLNDTLKIVVNDYFSATIDNFKAGTIQYPFQKLPAGDYNLKLKIWDTYNNSTIESLKLRVGLRKEVLKSLITFPNPFSESVTFQLSPLEEGDDLEVSLKISDITGKIIDSFSSTLYDTDPNLSFYTWNGTSQNNELLPKGMYFYQINVKSLTQQKTQNLSGKLLFIR